MARSVDDPLLLGEWACLGILALGPTHGFAVASRLRPDGDVGRVWSLSRALTYRSLDQLTTRGLIRPIGQEPGIAGGNRTILETTAAGRRNLRSWLGSPVPHLRDLRSELLLKLVLADLAGVDMRPMLVAQRELVAAVSRAFDDEVAAGDVVTLWRSESARAAVSFLDRLGAPSTR